MAGTCGVVELFERDLIPLGSVPKRFGWRLKRSAWALVNSGRMSGRRAAGLVFARRPPRHIANDQIKSDQIDRGKTAVFLDSDVKVGFYILLFPISSARLAAKWWNPKRISWWTAVGGGRHGACGAWMLNLDG